MAYEIVNDEKKNRTLEYAVHHPEKPDWMDWGLIGCMEGREDYTEILIEI
jgi:hypothetical protein